MGEALDHYLDRALARHLPSFEDGFPRVFDWRALCADVPEMARGAGRLGDLAEDGEADLADAAEALFPAAYVLALAALSAAAEDEPDPEALLARLVAPPEDEDEDRVADLLPEVVEPVEVALVTGEAPDAGEAAHVLEVAAAAWPAVVAAIERDPAGLLAAAGVADEVLRGVARVATILAAVRWIAAEAVWDDPPRLGVAPDEDAG